MKKTCFVIMPFSQTTPEHTETYWTSHFEYLKSIIEDIGDIEVTRSEPLRGDLFNQIIFKLINSDIVVADLTDSNPNVFWELGVRQSFKKGTITIRAKSVDTLPFDLSKVGTLTYYYKNHIGNKKFEEQLIKAIKDCCENPSFNDSPVLESISGRGSVYEIISKEETKRKFTALRNEYEFNKNLHDSIYVYIEKNKKNREEIRKTPNILPDRKKELERGISFTSQYMRTHALELLLTTRYLAEEQAFYTEFEQIMSGLLSINSFIEGWTRNSEWAEGWFEKDKIWGDYYFKEYEEWLEKLKDKY